MEGTTKGGANFEISGGGGKMGVGGKREVDTIFDSNLVWGKTLEEITIWFQS